MLLKIPKISFNADNWYPHENTVKSLFFSRLHWKIHTKSWKDPDRDPPFEPPVVGYVDTVAEWLERQPCNGVNPCFIRSDSTVEMFLSKA